jgi:hypothetical protein
VLHQHHKQRAPAFLCDAQLSVFGLSITLLSFCRLQNTIARALSCMRACMLNADGMLLLAALTKISHFQAGKASCILGLCQTEPCRPSFKCSWDAASPACRSATCSWLLAAAASALRCAALTTLTNLHLQPCAALTYYDRIDLLQRAVSGDVSPTGHAVLHMSAHALHSHMLSECFLDWQTASYHTACSVLLCLRSD